MALYLARGAQKGSQNGSFWTLFGPFLSSQEAIVHGPGGSWGGPRGGVRSGPPWEGSEPKGPKTLEFLAIDLAGFLKWSKRVILGPYPPPWAPGAPGGPWGPE
jgi:hypothetical protein